jgi:hypothetical protein
LWRERRDRRLAPQEHRMITESFLAHAASFFFATWTVIISSVSIAAFAPDWLPSKTPLGTPKNDRVSPRRIRTESASLGENTKQ